jgi:putative sterol carrier protein
MASAQEVAEIFTAMTTRFVPTKAVGVDAVIQFDLSGDNGGKYWLKISNGICENGVGQADNPKMTLRASADDWHAVSTGQTNAMQAFMSGKLKIDGDMGIAMKLQTMFAPQ